VSGEGSVLEALGGALFEEMVQTPLGNCSLNTHIDQDIVGSIREMLFDLSGAQLCQEESVYRKGLIQAFSLGFRKFAAPPYLSPFMDAPDGLQAHAKQAASSRRHQVHDGANYWTPVSAAVATKSEGRFPSRVNVCLFI
jgi:hypothetical protein